MSIEFTVMLLSRNHWLGIVIMQHASSSSPVRLTPRSFTKDRRDVPARPAHRVLHDVLRGRRDRQDRRGVLQIRQGPRGPRAHVGHPVRNQGAALAASPGARGGGGGVVVAQEEAAGRGGDVLVVSKAVVEGRDGDDGVAVVEAEEEVLRARDGACGDGVLDRRPL